MNRLIWDGYAIVLEGDPMLSSDDSYCGCNCRCCFNLMAVGKTVDQCTSGCGCDCECCHEHERKLTQYWVNKDGALKFTKQLSKERLTDLKGQKLEDYINLNFFDLWDHFDVNKTGLVEIERMSQFYKMYLKDMTVDL